MRAPSVSTSTGRPLSHLTLIERRKKASLLASQRFEQRRVTASAAAQRPRGAKRPKGDGSLALDVATRLAAKDDMGTRGIACAQPCAKARFLRSPAVQRSCRK